MQSGSCRSAVSVVNTSPLTVPQSLAFLTRLRKKLDSVHISLLRAFKVVRVLCVMTPVLLRCWFCYLPE
jgi:hypothetical protein